MNTEKNIKALLSDNDETNINISFEDLEQRKNKTDAVDNMILLSMFSLFAVFLAIAAPLFKLYQTKKVR